METCIYPLHDDMVQKNQGLTAGGNGPQTPRHLLGGCGWQEFGDSLENTGGDTLKVGQVWSADSHEVRAVPSHSTDL